jgi:hypothetical protein
MNGQSFREDSDNFRMSTYVHTHAFNVRMYDQDRCNTMSCVAVLKILQLRWGNKNFPSEALSTAEEVVILGDQQSEAL